MPTSPPPSQPEPAKERIAYKKESYYSQYNCELAKMAQTMLTRNGGGLPCGAWSSCLLLFQQMLFAFGSPAIPAGIAIFAHDTMTGHHNGNRIASTGVSHSPCL